MSLGLSSTGDDLDAEDNCEIVERVGRHHAHKRCEGTDDVADVTVAVDARGE